MRIMRRAILVLLAAAFAAVPCARAQELKTEDEKTLYSIGLSISQNLIPFTLTESELEIVKAGVTDGVLGRTKKVEPDATTSGKIQKLLEARTLAAAEAEKKASQEFLQKAAKAKGAKKTDSGLIYTEVKKGSGEHPKPTDAVKAHYTGTLIDGTVFDSSIERGEPTMFSLHGVIPCWTEGLQLMKPGGKAKLVCPPDLAYGDRGALPKIKPGSTLIFEVELVEVMNAADVPVPEDESTEYHRSIGE